MLSASAAIALAGVLGLLVGSFLNVVILRLPARLMHDWRQQSRELLELEPDAKLHMPPGIVREPSHCPHCKHPLSPLENVPLLSWLAYNYPEIGDTLFRIFRSGTGVVK